MNKQIKELSKKANNLEPSIIIGKKGLTENSIKAMKENLKNKKLIKVKILKSFIGSKNKKDVFRDIAEKAGSIMVKNVGFVITLYKKDGE